MGSGQWTGRTEDLAVGGQLGDNVEKAVGLDHLVEANDVRVPQLLQERHLAAHARQTRLVQAPLVDHLHRHLHERHRGTDTRQYMYCTPTCSAAGLLTRRPRGLSRAGAARTQLIVQCSLNIALKTTLIIRVHENGFHSNG